MILYHSRGVWLWKSHPLLSSSLWCWILCFLCSYWQPVVAIFDAMRMVQRRYLEDSLPESNSFCTHNWTPPFLFFSFVSLVKKRDSSLIHDRRVMAMTPINAAFWLLLCSHIRHAHRLHTPKRRVSRIIIIIIPAAATAAAALGIPFQHGFFGRYLLVDWPLSGSERHIDSILVYHTHWSVILLLGLVSKSIISFIIWSIKRPTYFPLIVVE